MNTDTTTLTGHIECIRELLEQVAGGEGASPDNRGVTLYPKFGPKYDPLRRVVTCDHPDRLHRTYTAYVPRFSICTHCNEVESKQPHSRIAYWEAAEQRDPGGLAIALLMALPSDFIWSIKLDGPGYHITIRPNRTGSKPIVDIWADGYSEYGLAYGLETHRLPNLSLAVLQAVMAALEAA